MVQVSFFNMARGVLCFPQLWTAVTIMPLVLAYRSQPPASVCLEYHKLLLSEVFPVYFLSFFISFDSPFSRLSFLMVHLLNFFFSAAACPFS